MMSDVEVLETRRLIRCCREKRKRTTYRVPSEVVKAVKENIGYQPERTDNLNTDTLFKHIERLFDERSDSEVTYNALIQELRFLLNDNSSLVFCSQIRDYTKTCKDENFLLLLLFCHRFVNLNDDNIVFRDFESLYDGNWQFRDIKSSLQNGDNELISNNILEYVLDNGFADKENFKISATAKEKLFAEINLKVHQTVKKKDFILHQNITPKQLFYNEREQGQIAQLSSLLSKDNFRSVQEKLEKSGMRKGFACLFYGAPGTGKTETVYQIARSTGRDLMMVDIAETKSCWYGESEKRIKGIFDAYRSHLKTSEIAPILLFNEADAVIGKRKEAGRSSIDQTENAIQNIILQEMENLEGILIATTNLTQNLDKAFERRFLYKIEFDKPNVDAKEKIWQTMLPTLSKDERMGLAKDYSFSGGQIENIVRKYTVDGILNGTSPSIEAVHSYCQTEFLYKKEQSKKIGFIS
jgi:SpoVK/Ycf46/Vps4 family AAA+-type ATPase